MTAIRTQPAQSTRAAPRIYTQVPRTPREPMAPVAFTSAQLDILAFCYQEEQSNGPLVTIPRAPGVVSPMYANARVLELGDLVTLERCGGERVGNSSPRKAPWHYLWKVRMTDTGRRLVQEGLAAAAASALPQRSTAERSRRPVPDPGIVQETAPVRVPRRAPRSQAPCPQATTAPVPAPPVEPETEFEFI